MMRLHHKNLWLAGLLTALLAACAGQPAAPPAPPRDPAEGGMELMRAGQYGAAAERFLELAESAEGGDRSRLRLLAADAYLKGEQYAAAAAVLKETEPQNGDQLAWRQAGLATVSLRRDADALRALRQLALVDTDGLKPARRRAVLRLRIEALERSAQPLELARERDRLDPLLDDPHQRATNRQALWRALRQVDPDRLKTSPVISSGTFAGWVELAEIADSSLYDPELLQRELEFWSSQYPQHPAVDSVLQDLQEASRGLAVTPQQIGVLLPSSGRLSSAAVAVQDGIAAAWYSSGSGPRPRLRFYDANVANIGTVYDQAVADGCNVIIGPLEKDAVDVLATRTPLPVLTLALNRVSEAYMNLEVAQDLRFFQFALAPEDEARDLARRAWFDGHQSALVITPASEWGERLRGAFIDEWAMLGGEITEQQQYSVENREFVEPIKRLLNIDGSDQRAKLLQERLQRPIAVLPRRRQDSDFVFLGAFPVQARQIRPQLKFFRAGDVPVYATSQVFSGRTDAEADVDMDGIVFGDMPWVFSGSEDPLGMAERAAKLWPERAGALGRLFALGMDAYLVLGHLARMRAEPSLRLQGYTGSLTMDRQGRIQRQLVWAMFKGGIPVPGNTAGLQASQAP